MTTRVLRAALLSAFCLAGIAMLARFAFSQQCPQGYTLTGGVCVARPPAGSTGTLCSGTLALGTSAIASTAQATGVTATCTGLASTDVIVLTANANIFGVVGYVPSTSGILTIAAAPTANTITVVVANNTANSITPGALTLNYRVVR